MAERSNWVPLALALLLLVAGGGVWWSLSGGNDDAVVESGDGFVDEEDASSSAARRRAEAEQDEDRTPSVTPDVTPDSDDAAATAAVSGIVVDGLAGGEVSGARLIARDDKGRQREATSADDGSFRLPLPPGDWSVRAQTKARASESFQVATMAEGDERDLGFLLLMPCSAVVGRVVDSELEPLEGIRVELHRGRSLDEAGGFDIFGMIEDLLDPDPPTAVTTSDATGTFRFDNVVNGQYAVAATGEGWRRALSGQRAVDDRTGEVRFEVVMTAGFTLKGRCVDADDLPVAGVNIVALPDTGGFPGAGSARVTESKEDGRFAIEGVDLVEYQIVARHPEYTTDSEMKTRPDKEFVVKMTRGSTLSGTVTDADSGQVVAGLDVVLISNESPTILEASTDEEGQYRFEHVPDTSSLVMFLRSDRYFLKSDPNDGRRGRGMNSQIRIRRAKTRRGEATRDFLVQRGGTIEGRVLDAATGEPVEGASVRNMGAIDMFGQSGGGTVETDAQGRYRIANMKPGAVRVVASHPDYAPLSMKDMQSMFSNMFGGRANDNSDVLAAGQTLSDVDVQITKGLVVRGTVVNEDGDPVPRAKVEVQSGGGGFGMSMLLGGKPREAFTDSEGRFSLSGVAPVASEQDDDATEEMRFMTGAMKSKIAATHPSYAGGGMVELETPRGLAPENLRIVIKRGASLKGRLLDADGLPAAGRRLEVEIENDATGGGSMMGAMMGLGGQNYRAVTNADGRFAIASLPHGKAEISLEDKKGGWLDTEQSKFTLAPSEAKTIELRLAPTEELSGVVVNEAGQAVEAMVNIDVDGFEGWNSNWSVRSDADGRFSIKDVPRGRDVDLNIYVWDEGKTPYENFQEKGLKARSGLRFVLKRKEAPKEADANLSGADGGN